MVRRTTDDGEDEETQKRLASFLFDTVIESWNPGLGRARDVEIPYEP